MGIHYTTAANVIRYKAVELSVAAIKAIHATPVSLVPAQGAGKVAEFIAAQMAFDAGTPATAYTVTGADNFGIYYASASGTLLSTVQESTAWISGAAGTVDSTKLLDKAEQTVAAVANTPIVLGVSGTGTPTGNGTGVIHAKVAYRVYGTGL